MENLSAVRARVMEIIKGTHVDLRGEIEREKYERTEPIQDRRTLTISISAVN